MRIFEVAFLLFLFLSFLNGFFLKRKRLMVVLPLAAVILAVVSARIEGYRIQLIPSYVITCIVLGTDMRKRLWPDLQIHKALRNLSMCLLIPAVLIAVGLPFCLGVEELPTPTGSYAVGTQYMSFQDPDRIEELSESKENRNIPIQIWYPASDTSGRQRAPWIQSAKAMGYFAKLVKVPNLLFEHLSLVETNSYLDAGISEKEERYPVILFSTGNGEFYGSNVVQMEELASQGYIVVAVGHPYEEFASVYPDGTFVSYNEEEMNQSTESYIPRAKRWSDDMLFILDQLEILEQGKENSIFEGKLDLTSVGAFGHSLGGAASGIACLNDSRIKAFINMDGKACLEAEDQPIDQPFLLLLSDAGKNIIPDSYSDEETNYTVVHVKGAQHSNYTDFNSLTPSLNNSSFLGSISEESMNKITNSYILEFFNRELKGEEEGALLKEGASETYEEVTVERF